MVTFLPFSRAVKACAPSLTVCGLLFLEGCASQNVSRSPERLPAERVALKTATHRYTAAIDAGVSPADTQAGVVPPATPPDQVVSVELELPYAADSRPRAASPEQAAANDEALARWNVGGSSDPSYVSSQASYHPGTRVTVDARLAKHRPASSVPKAKHGLTVERVQAQARSHGYWPFRLCFEAGQRQKKSTGGETRVAFTIGVRGKVSRARLLDSVLDEPTTLACLVRETAKLTFAPKPARALQLVLSIQIWPGDAELPALPGAEAQQIGGAEFDPEAVRARLAAKLGDLVACFAAARRTDTALWGRLALATTLEVDGSVHRIGETESRFPNAAAVHCVQVVVAGIAFPSVNGKPFVAVLPIRLSPSGTPAAPSPETTPDSATAPGKAGAAASPDAAAR